MIIHDGTAIDKSGCIVGPLNLIDGTTILGNKCSVVNFEVINDDLCLFCPVPSLVGPIRVRFVLSIVCKTRGKQEEDSLICGVLIVVA